MAVELLSPEWTTENGWKVGGTLCFGEGQGIRERKSWELVHYVDNGDDICSKCRKALSSSDIRIEGEDRWTDHPMRCVPLSHGTEADEVREELARAQVPDECIVP